MDKILSARLDEAAVRTIGMLARQLGTSKKTVLENAIRLYAEKIGQDQQVDPLVMTSGAWTRQQSVAETVEESRAVFRDSMQRHQK